MNRGFTVVEIAIATSLTIFSFGLVMLSVTFVTREYNARIETLELASTARHLSSLLANDIRQSRSLAHRDGQWTFGQGHDDQVVYKLGEQLTRNGVPVAAGFAVDTLAITCGRLKHMTECDRLVAYAFSLSLLSDTTIRISSGSVAALRGAPVWNSIAADNDRY